jgi:hypothetical protein
MQRDGQTGGRGNSRLITSYRDFAAELMAEGILSDPWVDGTPRFRMTPVWLDRTTQGLLYAAASGVSALHAEAARMCALDPTLRARFFDLPPAYELMWRMSAPAWHGIARADVFLTDAGPQVCELNSDTPSGEPEAVLLNRVVDGAGAAAFADPNCRLADRVFALLEDAAPRSGPLTVGIVYPTELTDDLSVIELYARWFEARGARVILGSPFNLHADGQGGVAMFGIPCSVIWRHYKTDWWGERRTVWRSEDAPLVRPLALLAGAIARGRCAVVNPFGAVLTQNKRTMALLWEEIDRFAPWARAAIRRYLPFTTRLEALPVARLRREKEAWVLKSDYGCEGEEVVMGAETSDAEWARVLDDAIPTRWIAQRRFVPRADAAGRIANYGVYVVGGQAAGIFTRLQAGHTDRAAVCAPTMVSLQ